MSHHGGWKAFSQFFVISLILFGAVVTHSEKAKIINAEIKGFESENRMNVSGRVTRLDNNYNKAAQVTVYVYKDPALDQTDLIGCYREAFGVSPWLDERRDSAQDMAEIWLHRAMLEHPWRVHDPDLADIFFIPLYPVVSFKLLKLKRYKCGLSHDKRLKNAMDYLETKSIYFKKFGGADHVIACSWFQCHRSLSPRTRMVLRRAVIGINELVVHWASWACGGRSVIVPYTPNSAITSGSVDTDLDLEERDIPFFFAGSARDRPERKNLEVGIAGLHYL